MFLDYRTTGFHIPKMIDLIRDTKTDLTGARIITPLMSQMCGEESERAIFEVFILE